MHRPPRGRRKRLPPRSHRTAPVVFFLPQSYDPYDPYYGYDQDYESRHYRFTEQHYPEDVDDDDYEHDVIKYGGEQEVWYQRQPSGAEPRYTGFHSHRERNPSEQELRYQQQPLEAGDHLRRERSISESSNRQTSHQTSHSCSTGTSDVKWNAFDCINCSYFFKFFSFTRFTRS